MARIAQYSTRPIQFIMVLASDSKTGATGKIVTVQLAKGSAGYVNATGTVVEIGSGRYALIPTPTDTNTVGDIGLKATATGCDTTDNTHEIITNAQAQVEAVVSGLPTATTVSSLLTEAFRRTGHPHPSVAYLQRAENEWLEEVKREIMDKKRWHGIEETVTLTTTANQQAYTIPSPLMRVLSIRRSWTDNSERELDGPNDGVRRSILYKGAPVQWEEYEGEILFSPIPDRSDYTMTIRGTVDLSLVDKSDARLTRLRREWRNALLYGVMERISEEDDDPDNEVKYGQKKQYHIQQLMIADSRSRRRMTGLTMRGPGGLPRGWGRYGRGLWP